MSHLNKVMIVAVLILLTAYRMENWWNSLFIVLYMYYFIFFANLFKKQYSKENVVTRLFLELSEMPLIVACIVVASFILIISKSYPAENFDGAYLNAFVGAMTTAIARFKRSKEKSKSFE